MQWLSDYFTRCISWTAFLSINQFRYVKETKFNRFNGFSKNCFQYYHCRHHCTLYTTFYSTHVMPFSVRLRVAYLFGTSCGSNTLFRLSLRRRIPHVWIFWLLFCSVSGLMLQPRRVSFHLIHAHTIYICRILYDSPIAFDWNVHFARFERYFKCIAKAFWSSTKAKIHVQMRGDNNLQWQQSNQFLMAPS